jgi:hypothetical protein
LIRHADAVITRGLDQEGGDINVKLSNESGRKDFVEKELTQRNYFTVLEINTQ